MKRLKNIMLAGALGILTLALAGCGGNNNSSASSAPGRLRRRR